MITERELNELRWKIEDSTGIPAELLKGETVEENISLAKALIVYRAEQEKQRPKDISEQFAEYFKKLNGESVASDPGADAMMALLEIEKSYSGDRYSYPSVADGGNPFINGKTIPDARTPEEQFGDFFRERTVFNPKKQDGWTPLN